MLTPGHDGPIRVLLVDSEQMVGEAFAAALNAEENIDAVALAGTIGVAEHAVDAEVIDVVLVAAQLSDGDGVEACRRLRAIRPLLPVLLLGAATDAVSVRNAVAAGCSGFVARQDSFATLVRSLRAAAAGQTVFTPTAVHHLARSFRSVPTVAPQELSSRELEILGLLATGLGTDAIAADLHLSVHTVRNHVRHILEKVGAHSRIEAVAIATHDGVIALAAPAR